MQSNVLTVAKEWASAGPGRILLRAEASEEVLLESLDRFIWKKKVPALKPAVLSALAAVKGDQAQ